MFVLFLIAVLIAGCGAWAEPSELDEEHCDSKQLNHCLHIVPRTRIGLPRTRDELDAFCSAYHIGMSCMEKWMDRCLSTDKQKIAFKQISGARALMRFLCSNDTALRREYLNQEPCWTRVSPGWLRCSRQLDRAANDVIKRTTPSNRNSELCCVREEYLSCVAQAVQVCSTTGSKLLQKIAWVLAQDVATCTEQIIYCSAPRPPFATPIITTILTLLLYFLSL